MEHVCRYTLHLLYTIIHQKEEMDYKKQIMDNKKYQDDVYNKQENERKAKKMKNQNDFFNTNKELIEQKNQKQLNEKKMKYDFDNKINEQTKEQMEYIEAKNYMKTENNKRRYKEALDKQVNQQKAKDKSNISAKEFEKILILKSLGDTF